MSLQDIQSNSIRDDYMRNIVNKTIGEIHDVMCTVFGPNAVDAYITRNQEPYFTRDGKEVIASLKFNNELSMYILKLIYQAVYNQAATVGDGTTTVAVFYTNLYRVLMESDMTFRREDWNHATKCIIERLQKQSIPLDEELFKSMIYTCTQDAELTYKIYKNLYQAIMDQAYIVVNKSNIETDFQMTVYNYPIIEATKQFSIRPVSDHEEHCTIFHCNGMLNIAHFEVLMDMMSHMEQAGEAYIPKTIMILCNGLDNVTRSTLKTLVQKLNEMKVPVDQYSNIAIYTLDKYRSYDSEQIEDVSTIITDENGIGGLVNQLTFESLLYQAFRNPNSPAIEDLETFDCDPRHIDKMKELMTQSYSVDIDAIKGIRINKELGPIAKARYNDLKTQIANEKSPVNKVALNRRLKTMYGQFIEVEVGSKLIKDSQRKYELILDAILSASDAVEHGVLPVNSIAAAQMEAYKIGDECEGSRIGAIADVICEALTRTFFDLTADCDHFDDVYNRFELYDILEKSDLTLFDLHASNPDEVLPSSDSDDVPLAGKTYIDPETDDAVYFGTQITEPVSIMTTMLENSTLILELVNAKAFNLEGFMQNYI